MKNPRRQAVIASIAAASALALATPVHDDSPEAWETLLDLETAGRLLEVCLEADPNLETPSEWVSLADFAKALPKMYSSRIATRDAWGAGILVGEIDGELSLVSKGLDGIVNTTRHEGAESDSASIVFGDDVVFVVGKGVLSGPRTTLARQRMTLAVLRSIGTAVEMYSMDHNAYPGQIDGLKGLASIRDSLAPIYVLELRFTDGWGNPILYWSNREGYVLVSPGADGVLDLEWETFPPWHLEFARETDYPQADIIFANGAFEQWPSMGAK